MVKEFNKEELTEKAHLVRESILRMSANGGAFTGASLSCADIILFLFNNFNRINENPADPYDKDYFFLSKGHAVPALYAVFAEIGLLEKDRLDNHRLPAHPRPTCALRRAFAKEYSPCML